MNFTSKSIPIITVPHSTLRQIARPIVELDTKTQGVIEAVAQTLLSNEARGVGLAAPQVDRRWRVFATYISPTGDRDDKDGRELKVYVNPRVTKQSRKLTLGPDPEYPTLEGCLSIPGYFGPVPRAEWIEIEAELYINEKLMTVKERLTDFLARLAQHELDHLDGKLFTDYSLDYDLPVYQESSDAKKLVEISDRRILTTW